MGAKLNFCERLKEAEQFKKNKTKIDDLSSFERFFLDIHSHGFEVCPYEVCMISFFLKICLTRFYAFSIILDSTIILSRRSTCLR